jgi:sigma-E factor negative regulatory protein RseC
LSIGIRVAIEQGVVIKMGTYGSATAWVKTVRSSACESCASRESCNPGKAKFQEVEAINDVGALIGDHIQFTISSASPLKATFLLYLFPILCLLAGGIIGNELALTFDLKSSVLSVVSSLLFFAVSMWFVRLGGRSLGRKEAYRPRITRILGRETNVEAPVDPAVVCGVDPTERK